MNISISDTTRKKLEQIAKKENRSMSNMITHMIETYIPSLAETYRGTNQIIIASDKAGERDKVIDLSKSNYYNPVPLASKKKSKVEIKK